MTPSTPQKRIKRIGVLTSGGDAPGMNAAIRAVVRTAKGQDLQVLGIKRGYNGLINSDIMEMDSNTVNDIISRGGTILYTARCEEFRTEAGMKKAVNSCRYLGIDGLIAIGGDGTFRGARDLCALGVPTIGVPGTIDNDIACTHYSIGFDTASNTAIEAIDKLRDTMQSHERISVVEVMGRHAGHLALYVGIACGATAVLLPECPYDFVEDILEKVREGRLNGKNHFIIIVAEGVGKTEELAKRVYEETGIDTRMTIIGHIQRGGSPSARDRVMASRMGHYAVNAILDGKSNIIVCYRNSVVCDMDINEALEMKKELSAEMYKVVKDISI